jgi:putative transposase
MAIPTRASRPGTFFITSGTYNRRRLFQIPANAELFVATLRHYRVEGHCKLHAFVVMPDHVHLLLTPQAITLERIVGLIKGGFSHRLASKLTVWQRGFTDPRIRDGEDYNVRLNYLHRNPVEARLCDKPECYSFLSANPKLLLDEYLSG